MGFILKNWIGLVAIVIAIFGLYMPAQKAVEGLVGGVTNYDELDVQAVKVNGTVDAFGTRLGPIIVNTCSLIAPSFTVAASTTVTMDCAVTGVLSGDIVKAWFATSTSPGNGWAIFQSAASTTSNFITMRVTNFTGASAVIPASLASTTQYEVDHIQTSVPGL